MEEKNSHSTPGALILLTRRKAVSFAVVENRSGTCILRELSFVLFGLGSLCDILVELVSAAEAGALSAVLPIAPQRLQPVLDHLLVCQSCSKYSTHEST